MKILITGSKGFIGSALCDYLVSKNYKVVGIDNGFFKKCKLANFNKLKKKTKYIDIEKDIRKIKVADLKNFDAVVHLAALSNDPIGNYNRKWTEEINLKASVSLAKKAKKAKVKRFLFSSSCIMYGVSKTKKSVTEKTPTDPQTIYAKSKVAAEKSIAKLSNKDFAPVFIRNGTIYGISQFMRFDTVLNNFVLNAYLDKEIIIKSSGKQWRPVSHIHDVCRYFELFLKCDLNKMNNKAFNVGNNNHKISDLAKIVKKKIPSIKIKVLNLKDEDNRTYKVNFDLFKKTFKNFKFKKNIKNGSFELYKQLKKINFKRKNTEKFIRVKWLLKYIVKNKKMLEI